MSTCQSCLGVGCVDIPDDVDLYSIQGDPYLFVIDCPAGFDCNGFRNFGQVSVQCCDELLTQAYEVPITTDAYNRIVAQLVAQCAARLPFCSTPTPPVSPGQPVIYYYSHPASCTVKCPQDGLPFEYTVPPGAVIGTTQAQADAGAHRIACNLATLHRICLSALPKFACEGVAFSKNITATGARLATFPEMNFWQISSGALPDGLTFNGGLTPSNTVSITGTPTVPGTFTFTVQITDPTGGVMRKPYTICIIDITATPPGVDDSTLPDATIATPYTNTLSCTSCATGPLTYTVVSGALPSGLTLDSSTGVISGTPTTKVPLGYIFTIQVRSPSTVYCQKQFTLTVSDSLTVTAYWTCDTVAPITFDLIDSITGLEMFQSAGFPNPLPAGLISKGLLRTAFWDNDFDTGTVAKLAYPNTGGFSMFGWFKINSQDVCALGPTVDLNTGGGEITLEVANTGNPQNCHLFWSDSNFQQNDLYFTLSTGAWHFFHIYFDQAAGKIGVSFDNGSPTLDGVGVQFSVTANGEYNFGSLSSPGSTNVIFDEMGLKLDSKLTASEQTFLWNGGAGQRPF